MTDDTGLPPSRKAPGGVSFAMVDAAIFRDPTLPPHVKLVYVALAAYASDERKAFPSHARLAADCGLSPRAVGKAVKQGAAAGLWTITHTQSSNRYAIHDLGGSYVVGSGPLGTTCHPEQQQEPSGMASQAEELDHGSRPESQTTSSGDAYAAVGHPARGLTDRKIVTDRKWTAIPDEEIGRAAHYLIKAIYGVMTAHGISIAFDARDQMARALAECTDKEHALSCAQMWLSNLDKPGANGSSLAATKGRAA